MSEALAAGLPQRPHPGPQRETALSRWSPTNRPPALYAALTLVTYTVTIGAAS
jgi:hypothetical protein